jgi:hypothetical protein
MGSMATSDSESTGADGLGATTPGVGIVGGGTNIDRVWTHSQTRRRTLGGFNPLVNFVGGGNPSW